MKKIFKAIGFGIVLGAALFFIPFIFKFILIAALLGMVFRIIARNRRRHFMHHFDAYYPNQFQRITPIDGQWYKPAVQSNATINHININ
ncbi:hypothetical protein [Pedobacter nototheniae]|uniref:hypothetical protein n=1 Tax=Pedobacter nototheniae TaxID=2488994 RepID=UPI00292EDDEE|nr:hypothetical protein [Pedobacter nototheniae]